MSTQSPLIETTERDVEYTHDGTRMIGLLVAPAHAAAPLPGILLVHDAFGLGEDMTATARQYAELGYAVFAADVWGERTQPTEGSQIGPLIGSMASDRERWMGRIGAAHAAMAAQPEVDATAVAAAGYCFGGSSALEYARTGGDVRGVVSIHGGLDLLAPGWDASGPVERVLICTGSADPMATAEQRDALQDALTGAGVAWETDLYSGAQHAFTNPKSDLPGMPPGVGYDPRASQRAWDSTARFLEDLLGASAR
ncbi:dienelactone hydrolase family protein [Demequina sp. NBRC 110056]|uniref:dienelactone hydrolase family protein n=1 Tax=Demequina sp. NBRC 110056 TaxID=1570345 RepID=UPI0013563BCA|nr:dienelactone hydrolase family protein [Demequina sp. NBRC 110056]